MRESTIRVGIIGAGQIGKQHIQNYRKIEGVQIVAVADIDEPTATEVSERFGIAEAHTDFRRILDHPDIDAVDVCLHNNLHRAVTESALAAGKHVYCEKPMAGSYTDAAAMLETARKNGTKLSIQLGTLFTKETRVAKRLIEAGRLGRLYHARSYGFRRRGRPFVDGYGTMNFVKREMAAGGALYDMGVYHIAQVLYLLGCPCPQRITGRVYQECDMDDRRREQSGYNVEELGCGFITFEGGLTLDVLEAWAIHMDSFPGSFIVGNEGGVRLSPLTYHACCEDMVVDSRFDLNEDSLRWHRLDPVQVAYDSPQHHWIWALRGCVPLEPTAETALLTMLLSEGIYLSHRLGREVTADEVKEASPSLALDVG